MNDTAPKPTIRALRNPAVEPKHVRDHRRGVKIIEDYMQIFEAHPEHLKVLKEFRQIFHDNRMVPAEETEDAAEA